MKGSSAYRDLQDFQFCWYMKLLIESCDSEMPGYLPNDVGVLWQLAGARTMAYFQREGQSVLDRFQGRTADGRWRFNPRLLQVIQDQIKKKNRGKPAGDFTEDDTSLSLFPGVSFSVLREEDLNLCAARTFKFYAEKIGADPRYKLTEDRRTKYKLRLVECLKETKGDLAAAEAMTREAIEKLAASAWHVEHGHTRFDDHLFHSAKVFQDRLAMPGPPIGTVDSEGKCSKPGHAGLTATGRCWTCMNGSAQGASA